MPASARPRRASGVVAAVAARGAGGTKYGRTFTVSPAPATAAATFAATSRDPSAAGRTSRRYRVDAVISRSIGSWLPPTALWAVPSADVASSESRRIRLRRSLMMFAGTSRREFGAATGSTSTASTTTSESAARIASSSKTPPSSAIAKPALTRTIVLGPGVSRSEATRSTSPR